MLPVACSVLSDIWDHIPEAWSASGKMVTEFSFTALAGAGVITSLKARIVRPSFNAVKKLRESVDSCYAAAIEHNDPVKDAYAVFSLKVGRIETQYRETIEKVLRTPLWWPMGISLFVMGIGLYRLMGPCSIVLLWPFYSMRSELKKAGRKAVEDAEEVRKLCVDVLKQQDKSLAQSTQSKLSDIAHIIRKGE